MWVATKADQGEDPPRARYVPMLQANTNRNTNIIYLLQMDENTKNGNNRTEQLATKGNIPTIFSKWNPEKGSEGQSKQFIRECLQKEDKSKVH